MNGLMAVGLGICFIVAIVFHQKKTAKLARVLSEIFPGLAPRMTVGCWLNIGARHFVFRHCGMDGEIQYRETIRGKNARQGGFRLILRPSDHVAKGRGGLSINAGVGFLNLSAWRLGDMSEEDFLKQCKVKGGGASVSGTDLPGVVIMLLRKLSMFSFRNLNVYCGPDRFEVGVDEEVKTPVQMKEFLATSFFLLKELVHMRLEGIPMEEMNLYSAYGDLDFHGGAFLPESVRDFLREYLRNAGAASATAWADPMLRYMNREIHGDDADRMDMSDDDIYGQVEMDVDAGRDRERVILDDAHALHDGESRWME